VWGTIAIQAISLPDFSEVSAANDMIQQYLMIGMGKVGWDNGSFSDQVAQSHFGLFLFCHHIMSRTYLSNR